MKINKIRSGLYEYAKILGDANAVQKNKISRRIGIRIVGKLFGRILGKLFK